MPDRLIDLWFRYLRQIGGALSRRARDNEFARLTEDEVRRIEAIYAETFRVKAQES